MGVKLRAEERNRNKPASASAIPNTRGHSTGSLKNAIPAIAISAAPPASTIGTADSGPPFWNSRKNAIVPAPTQTPVSAEYQTPAALEVWFQCPHRRSQAR